MLHARLCTRDLAEASGFLITVWIANSVAWGTMMLAEADSVKFDEISEVATKDGPRLWIGDPHRVPI